MKLILPVSWAEKCFLHFSEGWSDHQKEPGMPELTSNISRHGEIIKFSGRMLEFQDDKKVLVIAKFISNES